MKSIFIILISLALLSLAFFSQTTFAATICRSGVGGYCINLAGVAALTGAGTDLPFLPSVTDLGDLLVKIFEFMFRIVVLSAFVALVIGGVFYLTAGDNAGRVSQGQKWMKNALFGLAIALLSYLILNAINTQLTSGFNTSKICGPPSTGFVWCKHPDGSCSEADPDYCAKTIHGTETSCKEWCN